MGKTVRRQTYHHRKDLSLYYVCGQKNFWALLQIRDHVALKYVTSDVNLCNFWSQPHVYSLNFNMRMGSPTLVFVVPMSKNNRCIAAEFRSHLSQKFGDSDTIYWKKLFINVCIYPTLNIAKLSNGSGQLTATFAKCNLHKCNTSYTYYISFYSIRHNFFLWKTLEKTPSNFKYTRRGSI